MISKRWQTQNDRCARERTSRSPPAELSCNEALLDAILITIFVLDTGKRVVQWNRTAEQFTGAARADVVGIDEVNTAFY